MSKNENPIGFMNLRIFKLYGNNPKKCLPVCYDNKKK